MYLPESNAVSECAAPLEENCQSHCAYHSLQVGRSSSVTAVHWDAHMYKIDPSTLQPQPWQYDIDMQLFLAVALSDTHSAYAECKSVSATLSFDQDCIKYARVSLVDFTALSIQQVCSGTEGRLVANQYSAANCLPEPLWVSETNCSCGCSRLRQDTHCQHSANLQRQLQQLHSRRWPGAHAAAGTKMS